MFYGFNIKVITNDYKKKSAETLLMQNAPAHTLKAGIGQTSKNILSPSAKNVNQTISIFYYYFNIR